MSSNERVVVAMSGGVDSSVAAALLVQQGYQVVGVMMRLWGERDEPSSPANRCCTPDAMADARRVAAFLDIPFYVLDVQQTFKKRVVDFFVEQYAAGQTPNPCIQCNRTIRFDYLYRRARALGGAYLATGHYARIRRTDDGYQLLQGVDRRKDQSYVLHMLTQEHLAHTLFPVGHRTKPEVRDLARSLGLPVAERAESMDLCFLADGNYRRFLAEHAPGAAVPGPILDEAGRALGRHEGLPFYTIGQRKGLGIAAAEPLYVLATDPGRNAVIVGPRQALGADTLLATGASYVSGAAPDRPFRAGVRIRYKAAEAPATVVPLDGNRVRVAFDEPLRDISPGQGAVWYDGPVVLGGGIITRAWRRELEPLTDELPGAAVEGQAVH